VRPVAEKHPARWRRGRRIAVGSRRRVGDHIQGRKTHSGLARPCREPQEEDRRVPYPSLQEQPAAFGTRADREGRRGRPDQGRARTQLQLWSWQLGGSIFQPQQPICPCSSALLHSSRPSVWCASAPSSPARGAGPVTRRPVPFRSMQDNNAARLATHPHPPYFSVSRPAAPPFHGNGKRSGS
jgi:hypothetical protein